MEISVCKKLAGNENVRSELTTAGFCFIPIGHSNILNVGSENLSVNIKITGYYIEINHVVLFRRSDVENDLLVSLGYRVGESRRAGNGKNQEQEKNNYQECF